MSDLLTAVNYVLSKNHSAPVTSLTGGGPGVGKARNLIETVSTDVQAEGWWFNRTEDVVLTPAADGKVSTPAFMLRVDVVSPPGYRAINGYIVDTQLNDTHDQDLEVTIKGCFELDYETLPAVVQRYIRERAARLFSHHTGKDGDRASQPSADEVEARGLLHAENTRQMHESLLQTSSPFYDAVHRRPPRRRRY